MSEFLGGVPNAHDKKAAFHALVALTDEERGEVLCWFCRGCYRYVGPGDNCHCEDDE